MQGYRVAVFVVAVLGGAALTRAQIVTRPAGGAPSRASSSGDTYLSPSVWANWATERGADNAENLQWLVLWRGAPGWFMPDGASGTTFGGAPNSRWRTITMGDISLTMVVNEITRQLTFQNTTVALDEANVIFVDEVGTANGPRVTGTMRIERRMPGSAGQIGLAIRAIPRIMTFLQCDVVPVEPRKQHLRNACLVNLGVDR